jgi:hypothetical protein
LVHGRGKSPDLFEDKDCHFLEELGKPVKITMSIYSYQISLIGYRQTFILSGH